MDIRAARAEDVPALLVMVQDLARHHGDTPLADAETLARDIFGGWAQALVLQDGGNLIGYALLLPLMRAHLGQRGMDLHHLFIVESARSQGYGTALLKGARAHALEQDCVYLTVSTQDHNAEARDFYIHHGFSHAPPGPWRFAMDLSRG
jgi:GNAT superfamily N-acetyltransferase